MTAADQPARDAASPLDPTKLGADESPATTSRDDSHDMSTVLADDGQQDAAPPAEPAGRAAHSAQNEQGSDFDRQRQQGAAGPGGNPSDVGQGQGMGRSSSNGDEDRGYDQSGHRGGLGSSGGREDLSDRQPADQNPFTGGYNDQPAASQSAQLGANTTSTDETAPSHDGK